MNDSNFKAQDCGCPLYRASCALAERMYNRKDLSEYTALKMVENTEKLSLLQMDVYLEEIIKVLESHQTEEQILKSSQEIIANILEEENVASETTF